MSLLIDMPIPTKLKLSALWASTMFCYLYCDYFELYTPGKLERMLQGDMGPLGSIDQRILFWLSVMIETVLTALVVWHALRWPKATATA